MIMDERTVIRAIRVAEANYPVDKWLVDGFHIWPLIRIFIAGMMGMPIEIGIEGRFKRYGYLLRRIAEQAKGYVRYAYANIADGRGNLKMDGLRDVVLLSDGVSFVEADGLWYDRFCDPIIEECRAKDVSTYLLTPLNRYYVPRHTPSKLIGSRIDLIKIKSALGFILSGSYSTQLSGYEECTKEICGHIPVEKAFDLYNIKRSIARIYAGVTYFRDILQRLSPRIAFQVSYYNLEGMAFNAACHQMGVPVVELQHGVAGELHLAYADWNKIPDSGYELLPDIFWCWSDHDAKPIIQWARDHPRKYKAIVGGNPWLSQWRNGELQCMAKCNDTVKSIIRDNPAQKNILLTLQGGFIDGDALNPTLCAIARTKERWKWWVRMHPCCMNELDSVKRMLKKATGDSCEIDRASELPLYSLLKHMDVHVTHSSSAIIEAGELGVPTVAISECARDYYPEQYEKGVLVTATSCEGIERAICQQDGRVTTGNSRANINYKEVLAELLREYGVIG
jgi:hypothetical protein